MKLNFAISSHISNTKITSFYTDFFHNVEKSDRYDSSHNCLKWVGIIKYHEMSFNIRSIRTERSCDNEASWIWKTINLVSSQPPGNWFVSLIYKILIVTYIYIYIYIYIHVYANNTCKLFYVVSAIIFMNLKTVTVQLELWLL